jgi:O-antigen/teichoic acid export membrane protein
VKPGTPASVLGLVARGSAVAFGVRGVGAAVALLVHAALARSMGATEYGTFVFVYTWTYALGLLAKLGFDRAAIRYGAPFLARGEHGLFAALSRSALAQSLVAGTTLAVVVGATALVMIRDPALRSCFLAGALAIPLLGMHHVFAGFGQTFKNVLQATVPEQLLRQGVFGVLTLSFLLIAGRAPDATIAVLLHTAAVALILPAEYAWFRCSLPAGVRVAAAPPPRPEWRSYALQMTVVANLVSWTTQFDVILVGLLLDMAAAGTYAVAVRLASLVPWVSLAAMTLFAPLVAELAARDQRQTLQHYVTVVSRSVATGSAALALTIGLTSGWVLDWFGAEYRAAAAPLLILLLAQAGQDLLGPSPVLLNQSGLQARTLRVVTIAAIASFALNLSLIPLWGTLGAATATATATLGGALLLWNAARCGLNIRPDVLGPIGLGRGDSS